MGARGKIFHRIAKLCYFVDILCESQAGNLFFLNKQHKLTKAPKTTQWLWGYSFITRF